MSILRAYGIQVDSARVINVQRQRHATTEAANLYGLEARLLIIALGLTVSILQLCVVMTLSAQTNLGGIVRYDLSPDALITVSDL